MSESCLVCEIVLNIDNFAYCDICHCYFCLDHWDEIICVECGLEVHEYHTERRRVKKSTVEYVNYYWCESCWDKYN